MASSVLWSLKKWESFLSLFTQEILIQVDVCGVDVFQVKTVQIQIIQGLQTEEKKMCEWKTTSLWLHTIIYPIP